MNSMSREDGNRDLLGRNFVILFFHQKMKKRKLLFMITRLAGKYLALLFLFVFLSACAQKKANNCVDIDENIILVNIQNGDRLQLAKLINSLAETNVKAIGVNLLLEGTKSNDSVLNNEIQ